MKQNKENKIKSKWKSIIMTASHFLPVVVQQAVVWRGDMAISTIRSRFHAPRQKSGYYGPDRSRPRDNGRSTLPLPAGGTSYPPYDGYCTVVSYNSSASSYIKLICVPLLRSHCVSPTIKRVSTICG